MGDNKLSDEMLGGGEKREGRAGSDGISEYHLI